MITGMHHFSFSVTDIDRAIDFYTKVLGLELVSRGHNKGDELGTALFGTECGVTQKQAELDIAVLKLGDLSIEFIEYLDPKAKPFHKNPSIAGSAHLAFKVDDIEAERKRLEKAGVRFHAPIGTFLPKGETKEWKWCYFRDPEGICLELVQQG